MKLMIESVEIALKKEFEESLDIKILNFCVEANIKMAKDSITNNQAIMRKQDCSLSGKWYMKLNIVDATTKSTYAGI